MSVLITGGAGYIGSHTAVELIKSGLDIVIADNLSNSSPEVPARIEAITGVPFPFYQVDCEDPTAMDKIFCENNIEAVIHFAGFKGVGESISHPLLYYHNNLYSTINLLEIMEKHSCNALVFSSSATVYGPNNPIPFTEEMETVDATNPYGYTKVVIERIIKDYCKANPQFSSILLRYFNPIGSHESGLLGDNPIGAPLNIMPVITAVAKGKKDILTVFGNDYDTPDGSCIRDYLHVTDLALGHISALEYAKTHKGCEAVNLGCGYGVSVLELISAFEKVNNITIKKEIGPRREGDLPAFWADANKAYKLFGWKAQRDVYDMCRSAWNSAKNDLV